MYSRNIEEIRELLGDKNSCVIKVNKRIQLLVAPAYTNNISKGIEAALEKLTTGYCRNLNGLLLGYDDVRLVEGTGKYVSTNPYIHYQVIGNFYVFSPKVGLHIKGVVNELSGNKVSFLAYRKYNVVCIYKEIARMLNTEETYQEALYLDHIVPQLKDGDECTLRLVQVELHDFIPHLQGYPVNDSPGVEILVKKSPKKPKKSVRFSDDAASECSDNVLSAVEETPSVSVKRKFECLSPVESPTTNGEVDASQAKPKKKKKKDKQSSESPRSKVLTDEVFSSSSDETFQPSENGDTSLTGREAPLSSKQLKKLIKNSTLEPSVKKEKVKIKEEVVSDNDTSISGKKSKKNRTKSTDVSLDGDGKKKKKKKNKE